MKEWGKWLRRTALLTLGIVVLSSSVNLTVLATDMSDKSDTSDTTTPGTSDTTTDPSGKTDATDQTDSADPSDTTNPSDPANSSETTDTTNTPNESDVPDGNDDTTTPDSEAPDKSDSNDNSSESDEPNQSDVSNEPDSSDNNSANGEGENSKGTTTIREFAPLPSNISFQTLAEGSNPELPTTLSMKAVTVKPHEVSGTFAATKAIFSVAKVYNSDPNNEEISGWEWKIDTTGDKSTYGTFRSESGTRYTFVATPPATDAQGNTLVVPTGL